MRKWFLLALLIPSLVIGPPPAPIAAQTRVADLDKLDIVQTVSSLFTSKVEDGGQVMTLGYYAFSDGGGNTYVYDADSTATIDGGFVMPGRGGVLSFNSSGVFDGTAGTGRYVAANQTTVNARQFGAKGDKVTDDTDAFLRMVVALRKHGKGDVFIPSGDYIISSTIDFGNTRAFQIRGQGMLEAYSGVIGSTYPTSHTAIIWDGADGGTMFRFGGSEMRIEDLSMWGSLTPGDSERAGIGWEFYDAAGVCTGGASVDMACFVNCEDGIVMGDSGGAVCCADMQFGRVWFREGGRGFVVKNTQGVNYTWQMLNATSTETVIEFERGGRLDVQFAHVLDVATLLKVSGAESVRFPIYRFGQVAVDQETNTEEQDTLRLLHSTDTIGSSGDRFIFQSIDFYNHETDGVPIFEFGGATTCHVQNMRGINVSAGAVLAKFTGTSARRPHFHADRIEINSTSKPAGWNSSPTFIDNVNTYGRWRIDRAVTNVGNSFLPSIGNYQGDNASGTTSERPTLPAEMVGYQYFDTTLGKTVWWTGTQWSTANPDVINVRDYGAIPGDATDDTAAIQAAIDVVYDAGGGTVVVPTGTYLVNDSLVIGKGVRLVGLGDSSIITMTADDTPIVSVTKAALNYDWEISDLRLQYDSQQTTSETSAFGIAISGASKNSYRGKIQNVQISGAYRGVVLPDETSCTAFLVELNNVHIYRAADWGVFWRGDDSSGSRTNLVLNRVWVSQVAGSEIATSKGFVLDNTNGITVNNCGVDHIQGRALWIENSYGEIGTFWVESSDYTVSSATEIVNIINSEISWDTFYTASNDIDISSGSLALLRVQSGSTVRIQTLKDNSPSITGSPYYHAQASSSDELYVEHADLSVSANLADFGVEKYIRYWDGNWRTRVEGGKKHTYGTTAPASGTWAVGDMVHNTAPTAGGNAGWICTGAGTPGTWKTFGDIAP